MDKSSRRYPTTASASPKTGATISPYRLKTSRLDGDSPDEADRPATVSTSIESYLSVLALAPNAALTGPPGIETSDPSVMALTSRMLGAAPWINASLELPVLCVVAVAERSV